MTRTLAICSRRLLLGCCLLLWVASSLAANVQKNPIVIHELKHDVSLPLSVMARLAPPPPKGAIEMREHISPNISSASPRLKTRWYSSYKLSPS